MRSSISRAARTYSTTLFIIRQHRWLSHASSTRKEHDSQEGVKYDGQLDEKLGDIQQRQKRTPWHREGTDVAPVQKVKNAQSMTKGKLLTTPSRLMKLTLPLTTRTNDSQSQGIEPLALLVHPTQPLSYLERLIQSELPLIKGKDGKEKIPDVYFRADDAAPEDEIVGDEGEDESQISAQEGKSDGTLGKPKTTATPLRGGPGQGGVETYSGAGRQASQKPDPREFVRWSSSTEIGDFIRDAARASQFAVEIEGASGQILVGVPSFNDRTHYLRIRLRQKTQKLDGLAKIKRECDRAAHKSAQRIAFGGFGVMASWWAGTYYFTFMTDYGWDYMEPITYLAGLGTLMLGYIYFLYHNREVSYRQALHMQISAKQTQLYAARGFDLHIWEALIEDANALRKEIKHVATEYDVDWDESQDEVGEVVGEEMRKVRAKKARKGEEEEEDDDEVEEDVTDENDDKDGDKGRKS